MQLERERGILRQDLSEEATPQKPLQKPLTHSTPEPFNGQENTDLADSFARPGVSEGWAGQDSTDTELRSVES